MTKPLLVEMKYILTHILNSQNISLRRKALEFVMELLSEIRMDFTKAEKAIKAEISGDQKNSDLWIKRILLDIDEEEYK